MSRTLRPADCHPDKPHWARGMCGTCYQRWWNQQNPGRTRARIKARQNPATCHPDKQELARGMCGTCYRRWWRVNNPMQNWETQTEYQKRRYAAKPPAQRREIMMRRYGISVAIYEEMLGSQGGGCGVCGAAPAEGRYLQVDHCHSTGKVRALLCGNCNSALGHAKDDPSRLRALASYVETWAASFADGAVFGSAGRS